MTVEIFSDSVWQMTLGERAAVEGILQQRKPKLAIEVGTAEGGSLRRIAAHAEEVHSFDLVTPQFTVDEMPNITLHTGDSHELLSQALERFAAEGRNVDFVLVDGDHSAEGVRRDLEDLLGSPAVADTLIVIHDANNEQVRAGLDAVPYAAHPKVAHVNLDFVPGYMFRDPEHHHELWGGLGLVMVDATRTAYFPSSPVVEERYYEAGHLYPEMRALVLERERGVPTTPTEAQRIRHQAWELEALRANYESVMNSLSWRITAPLRAAKRAVRRGIAGVQEPPA